jgi:hypothetical protein
MKMLESVFEYRGEKFALDKFVSTIDADKIAVHWSLVWIPESSFSTLSPCPICGFVHRIVRNCTILRDEWSGRKSPGIGRAKAALKRLADKEPYCRMFED